MEIIAISFAALMAYGVFGIIIAIAIYFLPCIIAGFRDAPSGWLFFVNLIAGWSIIFWVVCLIWAFFTEKRLPPAPQQIVITHIDGNK